MSRNLLSILAQITFFTVLLLLPCALTLSHNEFSSHMSRYHGETSIRREQEYTTQQQPTSCIDRYTNKQIVQKYGRRCHRSLDLSRTSLSARTYAGMIKMLDALCPVQYRTLDCANECSNFDGKQQLIAKINYVGFLCDNLQTFTKYRACYTRSLTDTTFN